MMKTVFRPVALAVTILVPQTGASTAATVDHINPPARLMVEHAEILILDGAASEGYLTIWNGTMTQANLISVRSDGFGKVRIRQGGTKVAPAKDIFPIPGHAELKMTEDGIRLELAGPSVPVSQADRSDLTLVFGNGLTLTVDATIVRSRDLLTDHHHGEEDQLID